MYEVKEWSSYDLISTAGNLILTTLEDNNILIFDTVRDFRTERKPDSFLSTREICAGSWSIKVVEIFNQLYSRIIRRFMLRMQRELNSNHIYAKPFFASRAKTYIKCCRFLHVTVTWRIT